jgi:hypothetical protein
MTMAASGLLPPGSSQHDPMLLEVRRPRIVTTGRTQSYRVILTLSSADPQEDVALFVCVNDGVTPQFDRIAEPQELRLITTTPTAPTFRTAQLDLLMYSKDLADALIAEVVADLQLQPAGVSGVQVLSGATELP